MKYVFSQAVCDLYSLIWEDVASLNYAPIIIHDLALYWHWLNTVQRAVVQFHCVGGDFNIQPAEARLSQPMHIATDSHCSTSWLCSDTLKQLELKNLINMPLLQHQFQFAMSPSRNLLVRHFLLVEIKISWNFQQGLQWATVKKWNHFQIVLQGPVR